MEIDDTFLDIGVLFSQFLMYLCLCYLGIKGKQFVYEVLDAVEALLRGGEVQQLVYRQYSCAVDDSFVMMVNYHVAIVGIFPAKGHDVDAELGFQFLLQFFLVGTHIPVLFEDAPQLAAAVPVPVAWFVQCRYFSEGDFQLNLAAMLDEYGIVLLIGLVAHR